MYLNLTSHDTLSGVQLEQSMRSLGRSMVVGVL